jgi:hypothetical protein
MRRLDETLRKRSLYDVHRPGGGKAGLTTGLGGNAGRGTGAVIGGETFAGGFGIGFWTAGLVLGRVTGGLPPAGAGGAGFPDGPGGGETASAF